VGRSPQRLWNQPHRSSCVPPCLTQISRNSIHVAHTPSHIETYGCHMRLTKSLTLRSCCLSSSYSAISSIVHSHMPHQSALMHIICRDCNLARQHAISALSTRADPKQLPRATALNVACFYFYFHFFVTKEQNEAFF
jgi:hypothetical protein